MQIQSKDQIISKLMAIAHKRSMGDDCIGRAKRQGGVLLTDCFGEVCGWRDKLRDPQTEKPGSFAIDKDGQIFEARGGNEYDGAERWELIGDSYE